MISSLLPSAMMDFIVECTILDAKRSAAVKNNEDDRLWKIYTDGSSNDYGSGDGVVLESHDRYPMEHFIRFEFKASNNAAEYKATFAGMDLAKTIKARKILIKSDSRLMVRQSIREFETR